ncbi:hypothetical protein [Sulfidibacter corallicola]
MKSLRTSVLRGVWLLCLSGIAGTAGDLDNILAKNYEARGGLEKLRATSSIRVKGEVISSSLKMHFAYVTDGGKIRLEYVMNDNHIIMLYTGKEAWQVNPMLGNKEPRCMGTKEVAWLEEMADTAGPLVDWRKKKHKVRYVGDVKLGDRDTYKIELVTAAKHKKDFFIDKETHLVLMVSEKSQGKKPVEKRTMTYQKIGGLIFPKRIEKRDLNQCPHEEHDAQTKCYATYEVAFEDISLNPPIDVGLFKIRDSSSLLATAK